VLIWSCDVICLFENLSFFFNHTLCQLVPTSFIFFKQGPWALAVLEMMNFPPCAVRLFCLVLNSCFFTSFFEALLCVFPPDLVGAYFLTFLQIHWAIGNIFSSNLSYLYQYRLTLKKKNPMKRLNKEK